MILATSSFGLIEAAQGPILAVTDGKLVWFNEWNVQRYGICCITQTGTIPTRLCLRPALWPTMRTEWRYLPERSQ